MLVSSPSNPSAESFHLESLCTGSPHPKETTLPDERMQLARVAEDLYPTWEKNRDQWNLTGGDHPYHYLGSAIWFTRIGHAMAEAMKELRAAQ